MNEITRDFMDKGMRPEILEFLDTSNSFEVRGMRILLEYFYANEKFRSFYSSGLHGISVFGSARVKAGDPVYENARKLGKYLYQSGYAVITGASGGVMEAANQGVSEGILEKLLKSHKLHRGETVDLLHDSREYTDELSRYSIGLKITLPNEKDVNPYLGEWVSFHYFAIRKLYFAMLCEGFVRFDGGWGTRDEFWEVATLVQTGKTPLMPIIVLANEGGRLKEEIEEGIESGYISEEDRHLIDMVDNPHDVVKILNDFYRVVKKVHYKRDWEIEISIRKPVPRKNRDSMNNYMKLHPGIFEEILFSGEKVVVRGFSFKSFGHLRRLVNALNGVEEF